MNKKGKVILLPTGGKITNNSIVMFSGAIGRVTKYSETISTIIMQGVEEVDVPTRALHLLKYFVVNNKNSIVGELSYDDYNRVQDNKVIYYMTTPIKRKAEIGNTVKITRLSRSDTAILDHISTNDKKYVEGVIISCSGRIYTIRVLDGEFPVIKTRREHFELTNGNIKNICSVTFNTKKK